MATGSWDPTAGHGLEVLTVAQQVAGQLLFPVHPSLHTHPLTHRGQRLRHLFAVLGNSHAQRVLAAGLRRAHHGQDRSGSSCSRPGLRPGRTDGKTIPPRSLSPEPASRPRERAVITQRRASGGCVSVRGRQGGSTCVLLCRKQP